MIIKIRIRDAPDCCEKWRETSGDLRMGQRDRNEERVYLYPTENYHSTITYLFILPFMFIYVSVSIYLARGINRGK